MLNTKLAPHKRILVSGIGTEVGKTVSTATLCGLLGYDYWKPVQAGGLDESDSIFAANIIGKDKVHPEAFQLQTPCSPHEAARIDGVKIGLEDLTPPPSLNNLLIEGAGGLMVPINERADNYIDYAQTYDLPVILVVRHYLGSINHTLLSIQALKDAEVDLLGLVISGDNSQHSETIIKERFPEVEILLTLPEFDKDHLVSEIKSYCSTK